MAVNKVTIYNAGGVEETLVDLTGDTVSPEVLTKGYIATNSKGEKIVGTNENVSTDADTVDGLHFVVSNTPETDESKTNLLTIIIPEG